MIQPASCSPASVAKPCATVGSVSRSCQRMTAGFSAAPATPSSCMVSEQVTPPSVQQHDQEHLAEPDSLSEPVNMCFLRRIKVSLVCTLSLSWPLYLTACSRPSDKLKDNRRAAAQAAGPDPRDRLLLPARRQVPRYRTLQDISGDMFFWLRVQLTHTPGVDVVQKSVNRSVRNAGHLARLLMPVS